MIIFYNINKIKHNFVIVVLLISNQIFYSQKTIPIMAFFGVSTDNVSDFERFKDAGFSVSFNIYKNNKEGIKALDAAKKAGIGIIYYTDELFTNTYETVMEIKKHPALLGYYIADEPSVNDFNWVKTIINDIKLVDDKHLFYVNLYPNYATENQIKTQKYKDYLMEFAEKIPITFFSFDNYPVSNNKINSFWYENLEAIRELSVKNNKPFWGFANATIFNNDERPTEEGIKIQQFSNLLYGAQGLEYFTYWTLDNQQRQKNNFGYAIVYNNGLPTPTFEIVKKINHQINKLSWIFYGCKVKSIYHSGVVIPKGTVPLKKLPECIKFLKFDKNDGFLISNLQNMGKNFCVILNKNLSKFITINYKVTNHTKNINAETGALEVNFRKKGVKILKPGDLMIFMD